MRDSFERAVLVIAFVCVALGAGARLWHLDAHVFSSDETVSAQHVAGYTERDVIGRLGSGDLVRASDAARLIDPGEGRGLSDVVKSLAAEDAQHPPLFYLTERLWLERAGSSVETRRALPALLGLLGIAAAGFLCWVVTGSLVGGWVGAALFALSPFQIVFAQVMREYSLFATLTCIATALFVLMVRRPNPAMTITYTVTATAGLYTFSLFALLLAAHVTILALLRPARRAWIGGAVAIAAAFVSWIPWLIVLVRQQHTIAATNDWSGQRWSIPALAAKTLFNASTAFFDLHYIDVRWAPVGALVLVILAWSLISLRGATREARAVVVATLAWCFGAMLVVDVVAGGHRSTVARYVTPAFCVLVVAVAAAFTAAVRQRSRRAYACAAVLMLCGAGVLSIVGRAANDAWWDNAKDASVRPLAAAIDRERLPVYVTDVNWPLILNLTNYVRTDATFALVDADRLPTASRRNRPALVLTTSDRSKTSVRNDADLGARSIYEAPTAPSPVAAFRRGFATAASDSNAKAALLMISGTTGSAVAAGSR